MSKHLLKILLSSQFGKLSGEEQCDCACPAKETKTLPSRGSTRPTVIHCTNNYFSVPYDSYRILFNKRSWSQVSVLNQTAYQLWDRFRNPKDVSKIGVLEQEAATQMMKAGLLEAGTEDAPTGQTKPDILNIWLHLTNRCNLRCDYCYLPHIREDMAPETGRAAIEATFASAVAHGFQKVKIKYAGGEPLLRFPLIVELHQYAQALAEQHQLELDGVVLSNGTLLTAGMVGTLKSLGLRMMISLDGLGQYHDCHRSYAGGRGSCADVQEAIETAQSLGLTPHISITVSGRNVAGLPEVVGWVLQHDLPFSLNFYRENDLSSPHEDLKLEEENIIAGMLAAFKVIEADLPEYSILAALTDRANLSTPHARTCGVGQNYLVFDVQGQVSKCQMQMDHVVSVNADTDALTALQKDDLGIQNLPVEEKEGCRDCQWRYWCAGGCPLATYRATGRYDVKSPYCSIYQAIFPEVLRLEGLRLLKYQDDPEIVEKIVL